MSRYDGLNRRTLLRHAGLAAAAGAVIGGAPIADGAPSAVLARGTRYDFDRVYSRIGTDSTKWDAQIAKYGKDSIVAGMGVADMDFRCAPFITESLKERIAHENWGYLSIPKSFPDGIVRWNEMRYGVTVNPANLEITTGVRPGLLAAIRAFNPRGSKVLLTTPVYNGFYGDLAKTDTLAEESPMILTDGRYSIDFDDFERRIGPDTKTFLLCNPQNPTGNCWSRNDLTRIGEICLRHGIIVLADEVHCDFVRKGERHTPFASLDKEIARNSVTFQSANKSFSLAAMRCAWCFSDNAEYMTRIKALNRPDITTLGMIATLAAYTEGEDWLNQVIDYIDGTMELTERIVKAQIPLVKFVKPQGTYLAWLDVRQAMERIGANDIAQARNKAKLAGELDVAPETVFEEWLVKNTKVHLNAGHTYGFGGEGHMRMNIATSRETVTLALDNVANALGNL